MVKRSNLLFLLLLLSAILPKAIQAQEIISFHKTNEFYAVLEVKATGNRNISIDPSVLFQEPGYKYTSMKVEFREIVDSPVNIHFIKPNGNISSLVTPLSEQSTGAFNDFIHASPLEVFEVPQSRINIEIPDFTGAFKIHLFYAPLLKENFDPVTLNKADSPCDKPTMISYTVWRKGLPDPKPPRLETDVDHLVIHHSAGNNNDTNYINIVRNIYLLHTQSNGWDDIGYNFLVAPNGVIFNGRDPQGVADDDNILGAHLCGKNQNTMGVCLMGDYMKIRPNILAIKSLEYLLAWKLKKDRLNAYGQTKHPRETGEMLNTICGHRDGCSTDCPGDSLYKLIPVIKAEAARIADSCGLNLGVDQLTGRDRVSIYPNPSHGMVTLRRLKNGENNTIEIYGLAGNLVLNSHVTNGISLDLPIASGLYIYRVLSEHQPYAFGYLSIVRD